MSLYISETCIIGGRLEVSNIPLVDNMPVKVIIVPKADLSKISFPHIWEKSKGIQGNLSDDVVRERDGL